MKFIRQPYQLSRLPACSPAYLSAVHLFDAKNSTLSPKTGHISHIKFMISNTYLGPTPIITYY